MGGFWGYTSGLSTGLGSHLKNFDLDYAISSYGDLGLSNLLSVRFNYK